MRIIVIVEEYLVISIPPFRNLQIVTGRAYSALNGCRHYGSILDTLRRIWRDCLRRVEVEESIGIRAIWALGRHSRLNRIPIALAICLVQALDLGRGANTVI